MYENASFSRSKDTVATTNEIEFLIKTLEECGEIDKEDLLALMRAYYLYLKNLQKEFLDLIEFCFDDEYYPEILGKMKPYERFYIYRNLNDIPCIFDRTETFKTTTFYTHNDNIPVWLTDKGYLKRNS